MQIIYILVYTNYSVCIYTIIRSYALYMYIYAYFIILSFILMYILQTYIFSIIFYFCCWPVSYTSFSSWRLLRGVHHVFLIITVCLPVTWHSLVCDVRALQKERPSPSPSLHGVVVVCLTPRDVGFSVLLFMQLLAFSFYRSAQVWSAHHEPHPL